jgi:hypothetical protein
MNHQPPDLHISKSHSASVTRLGEDGWHLEIPAHNRLGYHLAQLDDHGSRRRSSFLWRPTLTFSLQARVSAQDLPGTWGFGLWNDPFSLLLAYNQLSPRLPSLPQAAWFFHASPQNYLSFRDDLPANGFLAATFASTSLPPILLLVASPVLALSLIPGAAQWLRWMLRRFVQQDAAQVISHLTDWHAYRLEWEAGQVRFYLDEIPLLQTGVAPNLPLSLVIWIDNQYAALPPKGRLRYGYLPHTEPAWLEVRDVRLQGSN